MHEMGIYTGKDLYDIPELTLIDWFGKKDIAYIVKLEESMMIQ